MSDRVDAALLFMRQLASVKVIDPFLYYRDKLLLRHRDLRGFSPPDSKL